MTDLSLKANPTRPPRRRKRFNMAPWLFALPVLVLLTLFMLYPIAQSLILSFQRNLDGVDKFAGLAQYQRLANDEVFRTAAVNTALFFIMQVPLTLAIALGIAYVLNRPGFPLSGLFQSAFFLPTVMGLATAGILFRTLLNEDLGIINYMLGAMGLAGIPWVSNPWWAKVSISAVLLWRAVGFNVIIYLAALQSVAKELYEAAEIDGATDRQKFWHITLPAVRPVLLFTAIMSTLATINLFDEVMVLTGGGPADGTLTLGLYLYRVAFQNFDHNYGSAIAWVIVLIAGLVAGLQGLAARRNA
ncbi:lactose ABC transporter permease [Deinococcus malanensis]|uniref:Lactose ABC transporter permease n=1 Tax=Deinococcus malanensis TaxID=1706855 RepID=A0ABQ2F3Q8_9DEIO|nr:sugar ABC transporter permease [Deinococcus malanensis]GGK38841.1 lactose ABC transporter permease [Deinococcus malanensis]